MIPGFSTRLGWEHGWKCYIANSKDWRSENLNEIELNCEVVKKVATSPPHFYINPPFSGLSPHSSKRICTPSPQMTQFLEGPIPPLIRGGRGSNYEMPMLFLAMIKIIVDLICLINFTPFNFVINSFQWIFYKVSF